MSDKRILSFINNKGGVGKTTSVAIIAQILAFLGKKVLMIDLDQQSNLSMLFNQYEEDSDEIVNGIENAENPNIYELFKLRLKEKNDIEKLIRPTAIENLFIIPSSKRHKNTQLNVSMNEIGNNNIILKKALRAVKNDYDLILIDNAPANDILTVNSMFASDSILVPVRMEGFSYKGLQETMESVLYIKEEHEIDGAEFDGVFITQAETNTNIYKDLKDTYITELENKFLKTPIRKDISVSEIETNFEPILKHSPDTNVIFDYAKLILEMKILDFEAEQQLLRAIGE